MPKTSWIYAGYIAICLGVCSLLGACESEPSAPGLKLPADAFFSADFATGYELIFSCDISGSHGGKYVNVYVNPEAKAAWQTGSVPLPASTVFLKVMYNDSKCSQLHGFRARKKGVPGSAPTVGDWRWQALNAQGVIQTDTKEATCGACHGAYKNRDFTATQPKR
ncbi:MAG: cytochrome P460 family protein [Myxococcales bacterium]|nr:cytochrome P460 family protein [Myxococcales bacterium]